MRFAAESGRNVVVLGWLPGWARMLVVFNERARNRNENNVRPHRHTFAPPHRQKVIVFVWHSKRSASKASKAFGNNSFFEIEERIPFVFR